MKNIKAAIFDLDGTLVDSMGIWEQIDIDYLSKKGHAIPDNIKADITHLSFRDTALYFKNRFGISDSVEEIINDWNSMANKYYSTFVPLKDGALELLHKLKSHNIKIALATSNSTLLLESVLKKHKIYHLFDAITTTDEAIKAKNFPDIYLLSSKKLGVSPEDCIVFEDIVQAVHGAKAAGMKVIAVYDKSSENEKEELISLADKYIYTFNDLL